MLDEVGKLYNPLLDDLDMDTLMEDNMNSESVKKNRLRGVQIEDPSQDKQRTMVTQERPGTQGKFKAADVFTMNKPFLWEPEDPRGSIKWRVFVPPTSCFYDNWRASFIQINNYTYTCYNYCNS